MKRAAWGALSLLLPGLGCSAIGPEIPNEAPAILASSAVPNPNNALSAISTVRAQLADSVAVRYGPASAGTALSSLSAAVITGPGEETRIPVLGLEPETRYRLQAIAYRGGLTVAGQLLELTTGALPPDLPQYVAGGPDPSPGYVAFAAGGYGLVIDNSGRVVWYHRYPNGPGLNFMPQPTGRYVARPTTPDPMDPEPWLEVDVLGNVTRTFGCARGLVSRFHDLIGEADGSYWIMCDETRVMDLTAAGGASSAQVTGTVIQHVSRDGALLFEWSPFDHFDITDLDAPSRAGAQVNWTHGNSIDLDGDGNLVVSFRSLSEITKIDTRTGAVIWRLGGFRNQFGFREGGAVPFLRQHGVRVTSQGDILLLDNLGDFRASRGERYRLETASRTAELVRAYVPTQPVVAMLGGTTQDVPNGHTLIAYGNGGRVEEYDWSGRVVWRIEGNAGYVFRAKRIGSLYRPGVGERR